MDKDNDCKRKQMEVKIVLSIIEANAVTMDMIVSIQIGSGRIRVETI